MWHNVANIPSFVPRAAYVPAGSRNPPASVSAGSAFPAGSRNRPASVSAGRPFSTGWRNHAARPMTRPTSHYFQHFRRPGCYNQLYMDEGCSIPKCISFLHEGGLGTVFKCFSWSCRLIQVMFESLKLEWFFGVYVWRWVKSLSVQLMKKMLKHKLEIEIDGVGNDMTYAEQLIQFIKNHMLIAFLCFDTEFMKVAAFGVHAVNFLMLLQRLSPAIIRFLIQEIVTTSRYVVPTGRVKVLAGRYVVSTGKDNVIVSAGRTKVIPAVHQGYAEAIRGSTNVLAGAIRAQSIVSLYDTSDQFSLSDLKSDKPHDPSVGFNKITPTI
ncbi:hypothetical protein Tco_0205828 [Tanacetum coccineum]